jgi:hypothetical protein
MKQGAGGGEKCVDGMGMAYLLVVTGEDIDGHDSRGSRSFGAKNNDPLEVVVFTGLFAILLWLRRDVRDKARK